MSRRTLENPTKVIVVDDQALVRRGLVRLLDLEETVEVVGEASDGAEALEVLALLEADVALVDARMPRMDGVELVGRLTDEYPKMAAVILTTFDDDEYVFGGLRAGAKGYLLKDASPEELVAAIRKVHRGGTVLDGPIATRVVAELKRTDVPTAAVARPHAPDDPLTSREAEVARLVGLGLTNEEIAATLYISEGTARNHVSNVMKKLGLRDRIRLALYAARRWPSDAH